MHVTGVRLHFIFQKFENNSKYLNFITAMLLEICKFQIRLVSKIFKFLLGINLIVVLLAVHVSHEEQRENTIGDV